MEKKEEYLEKQHHIIKEKNSRQNKLKNVNADF